MPDETTNPVWTAQTSQNNQTVTNQSWNDFVLDFWDFGEDNASNTEEVKIDSLSSEEESSDEGLDFDIDLWSDKQDSTENTEDWINAVNEAWSDNAAEISEWEDTVNDFDISMDYEWSSTEVETPEEIVSPDEEETSDEEIVSSDESWSISFSEDIKNESESLNAINQPSEGHIFQQSAEDSQKENNFQLDINNANVDESQQNIDDSTSSPLFVWEWLNNESLDVVKESNWVVWGWSEEPNKMEWIASLIEEEQRQPELGDLLSNSPIDLSEELNDISEDKSADLWDLDTSLDGNENEETKQEEIVSEEVLSEPILEKVESDLIPEGNNELGISQNHTETQNIEEDKQWEVLENKVAEIQQETIQNDERSETINNAVSQVTEKNVLTSEINISTPVELSDTSSSQNEVVSMWSEGQVQSTLSLDQILDSELLSNPQYADNSKASPQNTPVSEWGKSKIWLFIGVWVALLACWVIFLAFPSMSWDRKSGDVVTSTWTAVEYTDPTDDPRSSASNLPENPDPTEEPHSSAPDLTETPTIWWGQWSAQVVSISEWGDEWWDTQPIPYVWLDSWGDDTPNIQEPQMEEVDANKILDVISSFKSQGEWYYSFAEQNADYQLMKYAQKLINYCDNYEDRIKAGEGIDSESLSSFQSTANKLVNKMYTYNSWNEDVSVVVEATIGGESSFEWKDDIIDYINKTR